METARRIVILLVLSLLAVGPTQSAEESTKSISNTRSASCLVKATCDPAILPLNLETVDYLLLSSGVGGKAARETLDLVSAEVATFFTIEHVQLSGSEASGVAPRLSSRARSTVAAESAPPQIRRYSRGKSVDERMYEDMDEYEYEMMMEMEMGKLGGEYSPSMTSPPKGRSRSSSSTTRSSYGAATRTARTRPTASVSSADRLTYLFSLNIHLPQEVKPAATEFMNALVDNLRRSLLDSHNAYVAELQSLLQFAERQREMAHAQLAEATGKVAEITVRPPLDPSPADVAVHELLEQMVDLSQLTQAMTFEDVITELKNSVDPPLQIQPNWKDLLEMAEIEPATPSLMDPLTGIKLRKALEVLLAGVSSDFAEVGYVVDDGVIVIATKENLPRKMVSRVYEIPALVHSAGSVASLVQAIQESIEPESWFDLGDIGEGTIGVYMGSKLAVLQTDEVHQKIYEFLQSMMTDIPTSMPVQAPAEMIVDQKRDLLRDKQGIEMDLARLLARQSAIERQVAVIRDQIDAKVEPDPVTAELQQLVETHTRQLAVMERQYDAGRAQGNELADIKEKLTRAKIDLARRREQLSNAAGGNRLASYNTELADLTIRFAERTAELQVLDEQLGLTEQQFVAATMLDPHLLRIRSATRAFEIADQRVDELITRAANLQPPTVSILGGD